MADRRDATENRAGSEATREDAGKTIAVQVLPGLGNPAVVSLFTLTAVQPSKRLKHDTPLEICRQSIGEKSSEN